MALLCARIDSWKITLDLIRLDCLILAQLRHRIARKRLVIIEGTDQFNKWIISIEGN